MRELRLERRQIMHAAVLEGLSPDTAYRYELRSGGRTIDRSPFNPGAFRTLPLLEGRLLATIALVNDMHVGEQCSGTAVSAGDQSVPPCFTGDDYAFRMTQAAVEEIRRLKPDLLVANGDLSDSGQPENIQRALALLRGTRLPLLITRGNHDRRFHETTACGADGDCLRSQAFPDHAVGDAALTSVARVGTRVAVVGLDSVDPESGTGRLDLGGQIAWLDQQLTQLRRQGRVALVSFHHHVANQANATHPPPLVFGVNAVQGGIDALKTIGTHNVPLVLHGHTHRNYLARDPPHLGTPKHLLSLVVPMLTAREPETHRWPTSRRGLRHASSLASAELRDRRTHGPAEEFEASWPTLAGLLLSSPHPT
jgi:hypothetical protein